MTPVERHQRRTGLPRRSGVGWQSRGWWGRV